MPSTHNSGFFIRRPASSRNNTTSSYRPFVNAQPRTPYTPITPARVDITPSIVSRTLPSASPTVLLSTADVSTHNVTVNHEPRVISVYSRCPHIPGANKVTLSGSPVGITLDRNNHVTFPDKQAKYRFWITPFGMNLNLLGAIILSGVTDFCVAGAKYFIPARINSTISIPYNFREDEAAAYEFDDSRDVVPGNGSVDTLPERPPPVIAVDPIPGTGTEVDPNIPIITTNPPPTTRPVQQRPPASQDFTVTDAPSPILPASKISAPMTYLASSNPMMAQVVQKSELYIYDPVPNGLCAAGVLDLITNTRRQLNEMNQFIDACPLLSDIWPAPRQYGDIEVARRFANAFGYKLITDDNGLPFKSGTPIAIVGATPRCIVAFHTNPGQAADAAAGHFTFGVPKQFSHIPMTPGLALSSADDIPSPIPTGTPTEQFVPSPYGSSMTGITQITGKGNYSVYVGIINFSFEQCSRFFGPSNNNQSPTGGTTAGATSRLMKSINLNTEYTQTFGHTPANTFWTTPLGATAWKGDQNNSQAFLDTPLTSKIFPAAGTGVWTWKVPPEGYYAVAHKLITTDGSATFTIDSKLAQTIIDQADALIAPPPAPALEPEVKIEEEELNLDDVIERATAHNPTLRSTADSYISGDSLLNEPDPENFGGAETGLDPNYFADIAPQPDRPPIRSLTHLPPPRLPSRQSAFTPITRSTPPQPTSPVQSPRQSPPMAKLSSPTPPSTPGASQRKLDLPPPRLRGHATPLLPPVANAQSIQPRPPVTPKSPYPIHRSSPSPPLLPSTLVPSIPKDALITSGKESPKERRSPRLRRSRSPKTPPSPPPPRTVSSQFLPLRNILGSNDSHLDDTEIEEHSFPTLPMYRPVPQPQSTATSILTTLSSTALTNERVRIGLRDGKLHLLAPTDRESVSVKVLASQYLEIITKGPKSEMYTRNLMAKLLRAHKV